MALFGCLYNLCPMCDFDSGSSEVLLHPDVAKKGEGMRGALHALHVSHRGLLMTVIQIQEWLEW